MISLLVSWAFTLAGLMIYSKNNVLWIPIVLTALGAFGTWFWNIRRDHGKIAMLFTEIPHIGLWITYMVFPEIGEKITYYVLMVLGAIAVIAFLVLGDFDSSSGSSTGTGGQGNRSETDFSNMPGYIYSGATCYEMVGNYGWGVKYKNQNNSSDQITITNVYSRGGGSMSTNAWSFTY